MTIVDFQPAAPELTSRPYWQERRCPDWCAYSDFHSDDDSFRDREHQGSFSTVTLTLEEPDITYAANHEVTGVTPAELDVVLVQHYRETEPRIMVQHNHRPGFYLTPAEAARLAEVLGDFARQGGA